MKTIALTTIDQLLVYIAIDKISYMYELPENGYGKPSHTVLGLSDTKIFRVNQTPQGIKELIEKV